MLAKLSQICIAALVRKLDMYRRACTQTTNS